MAPSLHLSLEPLLTPQPDFDLSSAYQGLSFYCMDMHSGLHKICGGDSSENFPAGTVQAQIPKTDSCSSLLWCCHNRFTQLEFLHVYMNHMELDGLTGTSE